MPKKTRVQFDFNADAIARLDALVEATDAASRAEAIRNAMYLLEELMLAKRDGKELYLISEEGREKLVFPWIRWRDREHLNTQPPP